MTAVGTLKELTVEQYIVIEDEFLSTDTGRAFLRMRDSRTAVLALDQHHAALRNIKEWIEQTAERAAEGGQLSVLRRELMEMAASIRKTKTEIANIRPADELAAPASARRINLATLELDAIVQSTERATSDILNGAEHMMEIAGTVREAGLTAEADRLDNEATNILMACGFQDITGQRIAKVVATLRYLEERVDTMIRVWGGNRDAEELPEEPVDTRADAHLLNGPPLDGGINQSEVDALINNMSGTTAPAAAMDQSAIDSLFP